MTSSEVVSPQSGDFASLGLNHALVTGLTGLGYTTPTAIQREALPALLAGRDVLGQAATGTGKTAAFGLPLLQRLMDTPGTGPGPSAVVLVPTRELAMQVAKALQGYARGPATRIVAVYGGQPIVTQLKALKRGVDVVVATPGRLLDHLERRSVKLSAVNMLVLDEADEMLDMGFAEDLEAILSTVPAGRQTALFSATLPKHIADLAARHMQDPVRIKIRHESTQPGVTPRVRQLAYIVAAQHKTAALQRILSIECATSVMIFCRTRSDVDNLAVALVRDGHRCEALHGGMSQEQRDRVMQRFRAGEVTLLVATDVAARGLDIDHVSHVVNFDMPSNPEVYVHRIGRTGRAGREGVAITLAKPNERRLLHLVERKTGQPMVVAPLPSVAQLQEKRMQNAVETVTEALKKGAPKRFEKFAALLSEQFDAAQLASIALLLATGAAGQNDGDQREIPSLDAGVGRAAQPRNNRDNARNSSRGPARDSPRNQVKARRSGGDWEVAQLFIGAGRNAGVRPADLVGAIANELDLDARAIGAIQIADKFSLVEVPAEIVDDIVAGMRGSMLKGKRVVIRRDRED